MAVNLHRLHFISLIFILGAFIASLFFNGIDIRFFALTYILLLGWLLTNSLCAYNRGFHVGNLLLPVSVILFWLWLGLTILFSPVAYLSVVNFWWVGIFPLTFLLFTFSTDQDQLWRWLFPLLVIVVTILCLFALYQMYGLHEAPRAVFYNKNSLAALINLLLLPLFAVVFTTNNKQTLYATLVIVFLFSLLVILINSRGALLGFGIGLVIWLLLTLRHIDKQRLLLIGLVLVLAFIAAQWLFDYGPRLTGSGTVDRIMTLQDTQEAGHGRFVIWQPAWDLFLQHRWLGIGLGTYFLATPPTLHIDDHSAGFYVHNDYLQLALETGLPGLLLLVVVLLAALSRFVVSYRRSRSQDPHRLELIALFAALLSLAIHSFFTYNLYVLPIMFIAGFMLGRLNQLADLITEHHILIHRPAQQFRPTIYYSVIGIIIIILASYFLSRGVAHHYQHKGHQLAAQYQLEAAHRAYRLAQRLAPRVDSNYYADADLLRNSALALSARPELAQGLLAEAQTLLARAESLNPLRPQTPYIRGLLLQQLDPEQESAIVQTYQLALRRNPRFLPARLALARYLKERGHEEDTYQVLLQGLNYRYRQLSPAYLDLLQMSSTQAKQMQQTELAIQLNELHAKYRQDYANMRSRQRSHHISNPY